MSHDRTTGQTETHAFGVEALESRLLLSAVPMHPISGPVANADAFLIVQLADAGHAANARMEAAPVGNNASESLFVGSALLPAADVGAAPATTSQPAGTAESAAVQAAPAAPKIISAPSFDPAPAATTTPDNPIVDGTVDKLVVTLTVANAPPVDSANNGNTTVSNNTNTTNASAGSLMPATPTGLTAD